MKILLILDETSFFHPMFAHKLIKYIKNKDFEVFGALVTKIPKKNNIENYVIKHFYKLYFLEIFLLFIKKVSFTILSIILPKGFNNNFFSVRSVFKKNKIDFFEVENQINTNYYVDKISSLNIDLIVSSNSLYFGKKILDLPKLGSINRHTSLLPSYGGLWPVLQAISHGENKVGVTIHKMTKSIDEGDILAQKVIPLDGSKNLSYIYKKAFFESASLVIEAIDNLLKNNVKPVNSYVKSYYSFPSDEEWRNFRKNGGRFI